MVYDKQVCIRLPEEWVKIIASWAEIEQPHRNERTGRVGRPGSGFNAQVRRLIIEAAQHRGVDLEKVINCDG